MPLDAIPQDFLCVDGANEKFKHKFPMAHTKEDVAGSLKDTNSIVCQVTSPLKSPDDSIGK